MGTFLRLRPEVPEHWAAIAIGGSNATAGHFYRFERLKNTPMLL